MPPCDATLLAADGLERAFGALRALRGVSLEVAAGETLAVAGPNGAGKTTLLRILAGLMRPSAGTVRVAGSPVTAADAASRRPIGLVSHQSLLYDDLTLLENLTFAARLHRIADPRAAARRALDDAGLAERGDALPRLLSRGMLQRAAIARAILHDPAVLLLDEPFTGLDAASAARFRDLLAERAAAGRAVVIVTHHLAEAWDIATRVAVLVAGRWALDEPRTGEVSAFLPRYAALAGG